MKLKNIGLLLIVALAVVALAAVVGHGAGALSPTPIAGPTAYVPGASPTKAAGIDVETRNVSTPSPSPAATTVPSIVPSVTAKPVAPAAPAGAAPAGVSAKLVNYGTDKDTFQRGQRATGFITVQNTGNTVINDLTASVAAKAQLPVIGSTSLGSKDYTFSDLNIQPGQTKRVEFTVDIPSEYKGVSTAGTYDLSVTVKAGSQDIGSFSKTVKVT